MLTYAKYSEYRDAKGMNDYKIADACGVGRSTLSEWRRGFYQPRVETLIPIAKYLDIPLIMLVEDDES